MELQSHNSVAVIGFPSPAGYSRITQSLLNELGGLLAAIKREGLFRGVVIAGGDDSFAVGADLEEVAALEGVAAREFAQAGQAAFNEIARYPLPVVAAIRGYCLGGGLDLALACHARVATYDASFGHPGAALGLITGWGGTERLTRLVGKPAALEVLLTAERIPASQALTLGLVDELVAPQDLVDAAAKRIERLRVQRHTGELALHL